MSKVQISQIDLRRAQKSLKKLYMMQFGEDSLSDTPQTFSREQLILRYGKNLRFWSDHLPLVTPNMDQFCIAKHAICTNAIEQLWKKVDEYHLREDVEIVANNSETLI